VIKAVKRTVKALSSVHLPDGRPNVFLYSTPRSGSTWLMELIWSQPGFKTCNQPLYLESPAVRRHLGIEDWVELYSLEALPRIERYLARICQGRIGFTNPNPFRRFYRPVTRRIVFKEIHASADVAELAAERLNCRVLYLIRHPIAVTLSTERWPTLPAFLSSDHRRHFGAEELALAHRIVERGDRLERGVLAWCLQNAVPLRRTGGDWAIVSYEQLVLDPLPAIAELARRLDLPEPERMVRRLPVPSVNVRFKSTEETRRLLTEGGPGTRPYLVEKWRRKVGARDEARAMAILEAFGLDVYRAGDLLPAERYWVADRDGAPVPGPASGP
jgi:hypothetical protein